ncbi:M23 family metallopeptidase [Candidatus Poribacteria bacterium]|nr:M23 family metallopeptidase [Candidatus Poribacteria bacterium]
MTDEKRQSPMSFISARRESNRANAMVRKLMLVCSLVVSLLLPSRLLAEELVRLVIEESAKENTLYVQNDGPVDITVSFKFTLRNAELDQSRTTFVVHPKETALAFRVMRKTRNAPWNYSYEWHYRLGNIDARHDDGFNYRLPFEEGRKVWVTQGFDGKFSHQGEWRYSIDWRVPEGTAVHAARKGTVVATQSRYSEGGPTTEFEEKANYVVVAHDDGTLGFYVHLKKDGVVVSVGERIREGRLIGYSGNTGYSTVPHLHFSVYKPKDGWKTESIPIRFRTEEGSGITLEEGKEYTVSR